MGERKRERGTDRLTERKNRKAEQENMHTLLREELGVRGYVGKESFRAAPEK